MRPLMSPRAILLSSTSPCWARAAPAKAGAKSSGNRAVAKRRNDIGCSFGFLRGDYRIAGAGRPAKAGATSAAKRLI
jgi:hypothetical protein